MRTTRINHRTQVIGEVPQDAENRHQLWRSDSGCRAYSLISRTSSIVRGFSETDFNTDLRKVDMPTLIYTKTTTRSRADWCVGSGLRQVHRPVVRTWARP
jgi:hypothetical protein